MNIQHSSFFDLVNHPHWTLYTGINTLSPVIRILKNRMEIEWSLLGARAVENIGVGRKTIVKVFKLYLNGKNKFNLLYH